MQTEFDAISAHARHIATHERKMEHFLLWRDVFVYLDFDNHWRWGYILSVSCKLLHGFFNHSGSFTPNYPPRPFIT